MMNKTPSVTIILVNWNGLSDTLECLESLSRVAYHNLSIVVIDNGSEGGDANQIRASYPEVIVIEAGTNLGFTGGNNLGMRYALEMNAEYVLCLNNDTIVAPDFITHMIDAFQGRPEIGIAGAAVHYYDEPHRLATLGGWVDLAAYPPVDHFSSPASRQHLLSAPSEVDWVEGSCLMMRRSVVEALHGFHSDFFAYCEDVDLCLSVRSLGLGCLVVPEAVIWHKVSATAGTAAIHYGLRNYWHIVRRHATRTQYRAFVSAAKAALLLMWKNFFKDCVVHPQNGKDARLRKLTSETTAVFLGFCHCTGPRSRWALWERVLTGILSIPALMLLCLGTVLAPLYRFRQVRHAS